MIKKIPFINFIKKLSNFEIVNELKYCKHYTIIERLLWISKFAVNNEYLYFKEKIISSPLLQSVNKDILNSSNGIIKLYTDYINTDNGISRFIDKYSLLKKLQAKHIQYTSENIKSICENFDKDKKFISKIIFDNEQAEEIEYIEVGHGDFHAYGKSTAIVYLKGGRKIIYKPRSGGMDLAFNIFLNYLNNNLSDVHFKTPKIYDGGSYLWMEFIENSPCDSLQEIDTYYLNAGAMLAVMYILCGKDIHYENIIASGKHPIIIDIECLFSSMPNTYQLSESGMLPFFVNNDDIAYDLSAFGANKDQSGFIKAWTWVNINSNDCELQKTSHQIKSYKNQPIFKNHQIGPVEYLDRIIEGFRKVCIYILEGRNHFVDRIPFEIFKNKQIRILFRTTRSYANIIENSYLPNALYSETARREEIESGVKEFPFNVSLNLGQKEIISIFEANAMERMDIPFFIANTSEKYLAESEHLVYDNFFDTTPYDFVMNKINSLSQEIINAEIEVIKSAFAARSKYTLI